MSDAHRCVVTAPPPRATAPPSCAVPGMPRATAPPSCVVPCMPRVSAHQPRYEKGALPGVALRHSLTVSRRGQADWGAGDRRRAQGALPRRCTYRCSRRPPHRQSITHCVAGKRWLYHVTRRRGGWSTSPARATRACAMLYPAPPRCGSAHPPRATARRSCVVPSLPRAGARWTGAALRLSLSESRRPYWNGEADL